MTVVALLTLTWPAQHRILPRIFTRRRGPSTVSKCAMVGQAELLGIACYYRVSGLDRFAGFELRVIELRNVSRHLRSLCQGKPGFIARCK